MKNFVPESIYIPIDGYYTKKNSYRMVKSRKTGKFFPLPSERYSKWEKEAVEEAEKIKEKYAGRIEFPICEYRLVLFKFKFKYGVHSDFNNASQGICDVLEKAGIFKNDRLIYPVPWLPSPFTRSENRKVETKIIMCGVEEAWGKINKYM